jgi:Na+/glutamate symporter
MVNALLLSISIRLAGPTSVLALDEATLSRISGACMDFLVLTAVATLDFTALSDTVVPFMASCVQRFFDVFCFFLLSFFLSIFG